MAKHCEFKLKVNCPHLEQSHEAVSCGIARADIWQIDGGDMRLCTSRHYEVCYVYSNALRREIHDRNSLLAVTNQMIAKEI
jgi:hypothetical protein